MVLCYCWSSYEFEVVSALKLALLPSPARMRLIRSLFIIRKPIMANTLYIVVVASTFLLASAAIATMLSCAYAPSLALQLELCDIEFYVCVHSHSLPPSCCDSPLTFLPC